MPSSSRIYLSLVLCFVAAPQFAVALERFRSWFPRYESALNYIVDNNCSAQYDIWLRDSTLPPELTEGLESWEEVTHSGPLIACILRSSPDFIKANFASAALLLGLMPSILAMLGPSIQETSNLLALGDCPLLALLLCLGSPFIGLDRDLQHLRGVFKSSKSTEKLTSRLQRNIWLTCVEYLIAMGAIANIGEMVWELALKVSYSFFQGDAAPLLGAWAFVGFVLHLLGALTLSTCISIGSGPDMTGVPSLYMTYRWLLWRFSFKKRDNAVMVVVHPPTVVYFLLVSFVTVLAAVQIIFGTIIFSGVLFISAGDAVKVLCRFLASVIMCRFVVLTELTLVRQGLDIKDSPGVYKQLNETAPVKE